MIILRGGAKRALEISYWLKQKGLEHDKDFSWYQHSNQFQVVFTFRDPKWESMTIMRWS